jgi:hypothetical protein
MRTLGSAAETLHDDEVVEICYTQVDFNVTESSFLPRLKPLLGNDGSGSCHCQRCAEHDGFRFRRHRYRFADDRREPLVGSGGKSYCTSIPLSNRVTRR